MTQSFVNNRIDEIVFDGHEISVKRDDLIDPLVSGNKLYKLKYNVSQVVQNQLSGIVTFGGAFSNHIAATAKLTHLYGLKSVGIIRGEESEDLNPTLAGAVAHGMTLSFVPRSTYKQKNDPKYVRALSERFPKHLIIPEGGANLLGIQGAAEILNSDTNRFDIIACAMGTGTTLAGLAHARAGHQKIIGYPVHKHALVFEDVKALDVSLQSINDNEISIRPDYHFGGYAKWNNDLIDFIRRFWKTTRIKLDPIYTGKAMYGLVKDLNENRIDSGRKVLFIHTGGLQGVEGFEKRFELDLFQE